MDKSIMIAGAGGQVGRELAIADTEHRLIALTRQQLDITNPQRIDEVFSSHRPDIVINAAAYTQVDRAEQECEHAFAANRDAVANLASACQQHGIPLLSISTDYVFDGKKQGPYLETDPISPLGVYGESKAEGEAVLRATLERHIILRTSWVFSSTGSNFVKTMLRLGKERDELGVVNDQHGCPTSARSIAATLLQLASRHLKTGDVEWGTYHYCNKPEATWFEFARAILFDQGQGYENLTLNAISTADYPTPAQRPVNSVLDCSKLRSKLQIEQQDWARELELVLNELSR